MPIYFPQLNGDGLLVQRGATFGDSFETSKTASDVAVRSAYAWIGAGLDNFPEEPLGKWTLPLTLADDEVPVLEDFFRARCGRYEPFTFLDPYGNLVPFSDVFSDASWEKYNSAAPGAAATDPFGGNRAITVAGGSNGMLATYVLPSGDASGFVLCGSVWVKAAAAQQLAIGFIDSAFSILESRSWDLPAGEWIRIFCKITLATDSNVRLLIGGFGTWASASLTLFGAQCVPLPGPAGYVRTPGRAGLRPKVRLDTDVLEMRVLGPNETQVTVPLIEIF